MIDFETEVDTNVTMRDTADNRVFVFGSNRLGMHSEGTAKYAHRFWGAVYGCGEGMRGHSYAIPTKKTPLLSLPVEEVRQAVGRFVVFAREHPEYEFVLAHCFAGFRDEHIAPLFADAPANVEVPGNWADWVRQA